MLTCILGLCVCLWECITPITPVSMRVTQRWPCTRAVYICACNGFIFLRAFTYFYPSLQPTFASLANNKSFRNAACVRASMCVCASVCHAANMWFRFPLRPYGQIHGKAEKLALCRRRYDTAPKPNQHMLLLKGINLYMLCSYGM